ncbi:MAG: TSUP family transporter [Myxococcota bacterium]
MLLSLGPLAGLITTVLGLGGGMLLVLALQALEGDPVIAMAIASPALLLGNGHRAWLYRAHFPGGREFATPWLVACGIGAMLGGLGAVAVPPIVLKVGMALAAVYAVGRQIGWVPAVQRPRAVAAAGIVVGLASTTGGAGLLAAPFLMSLGLSGHGYLAMLSISAVTMHASRIVSFGALGAIEASHVLLAGGLAIGIAAGNAAGKHFRTRLSEDTVTRLQSVAMIAMIVLALVGVR